MRKTISIFLIAAAASCNSSDDRQIEPVPDSSAYVTESDKVDTILSPETFQFFTKPEAQVSNEKFKMVNTWKEDSMLNSDFNTTKSFVDKYGELLRFSPDSAHFIDLGSYNVEVEVDAKGNKTYQDLGPDIEISLVSINDKKRTRLIFLGPGSMVDDAGWMDNETAIIAGRQARPNGTDFYRVIWKYHLPTNTFYMYESQ
jgi:hypothetical protein